MRSHNHRPVASGDGARAGLACRARRRRLRAGRRVAASDRRRVFSALGGRRPRPFAVLSWLYAEGRGVERDGVRACALAQHSRFTADMAASKFAFDVAGFERLTAEADRFVDRQCSALSHEDLLLASQSIGCFGFGLPTTAVPVGPYRLEVTHRGLTVEGTATQPVQAIPCAALFAAVRPHVVVPPADALPGVGPRYLAEILTWHLDTRPERPRYGLQWHLVEVTRSAVGFAATELLGGAPGWPQPALPPEYDVSVSFKMIRTGHIRWRIDGDPPRRGVLLREERRP